MYHQDLQTIIDNFLAKNQQFFKTNDIQLATKGKFSILNYLQDAKRNQYNCWCRGLVLDEIGAVRSLPFVRFFNRGEAEAPQLKHNNCLFLEKLDGCIIGLFFDNQQPVLHTRRTISTHSKDWNMSVTTFNGKKAKLLQMAAKYLEKVKWWEDDYDCCFAFELVHEATRVVTEYPEDRWGLYLIGGRDLDTMEEMSETELTAIAQEVNKVSGVNIRRPHSWMFENENELQSVMISMPDDFEGFIAREHFSERRLKIKKPSYVARHHMIDRKKTLRAAIPLWLKGETGEIIVYFPDAKEKFELLEEAYAMLVYDVHNYLSPYKILMKEQGWTRKQVAESVFKIEPSWVHPFIFGLLDKEWDKKNVWEMLVQRLPNVRSIEEWLRIDEYVEEIE